MKSFRQLCCPAQVSSNHQGLEQSNQLKPPAPYGSRTNPKAQGGLVFILFLAGKVPWTPSIVSQLCWFLFFLFNIWPDRNQRFGLGRSSTSERRYLRLPALARSQAKHVGFGHLFMTVKSLLTRKRDWVLWVAKSPWQPFKKIPLI